MTARDVRYRVTVTSILDGDQAVRDHLHRCDVPAVDVIRLTQHLSEKVGDVSVLDGTVTIETLPTIS